MFTGGFAENVAVHADQVPRRIAGDVRQLCEPEVAATVAFDQLVYAQQTLQGEMAPLRRASVAAIDQGLQGALLVHRGRAEREHRGFAGGFIAAVTQRAREVDE
jgi:hypothetical protein